MSICRAHTKGLPPVAVDESAGLATVEADGAGDEFGHIERQEAVAIEAARVALSSSIAKAVLEEVKGRADLV